MPTQEYEVIIEKRPDGWFYASVPALPGCHAHGHTQEEATTGIREAIRVWLAAQPKDRPA